MGGPVFESRWGARVGEVAFFIGIGVRVLLGHPSSARLKLVEGIAYGIIGFSALMIAAFTSDAEFQGARLLPQMVPFSRVVFVILGLSFLLLAVMITTSPGPG